MGLADEIRTAILSTVKAPTEVAELTSAIRAMLDLIATLGRPKAEKVTLHKGTPHEEVRDMWLIDNFLPYGQTWLDRTGTLWNFPFGEEFIIQEVDLVALPAVIVRMYTRNIETSKASLAT